MRPVTTRKYEQRLRAETAAQTRRRILDALYQRLAEAPTQPVSVEEVARVARVARSTVYLIFGSRSGLFDALWADLLERGRYDRLVRAVADPDALENLRGGIRASVDMFAAHRDVHRVLHSMAQLDPDAVSGAVQRTEQRRAGGMAYVAQRLAEQHLLRPGIAVEQAADVLWLLTSFDSFDLLYTGRRLSTERVAATLVDTAEYTLCRSTDRPGRGTGTNRD
jgi:AcrR family transcriptional regulator